MDLWLIDIAHATDVTSTLPRGRTFHQRRKTLEELMDPTGRSSLLFLVLPAWAR